MNTEREVTGIASTDTNAHHERAFAMARGIAFDLPADNRGVHGESDSLCPLAQASVGKLHGGSAAMKAVHEMIGKVAPSIASVLLIGESGTGKELAAIAIHDQSKSSAGPFVAINCGAFCANLIEAELFGYERGAFTGAVRSHRGCFERGSGGTLFLDEITEMPIELQIKLLRAIESGRFFRVGGEQEIDVNVRIVAATNREPNEAVTQGLLREDLLYRLAAFPLPIPPLREREGDIELLAQHFLDELNTSAGTAKQFSAAAREFLTQHSWPGNVRELKNAVHRAFIMAETNMEFGLPLQALLRRDKRSICTGALLQFAVGTPLEHIEREVIVATLRHCRGSKRETAQLLGVSLKTLYNRLNEYGGSTPVVCTA